MRGRLIFWLGPYLILALAGLLLYLNWNSIPERFATHWGADGRADGWSPRTISGVYFPLALCAAQIFGLTILGYFISRRRRSEASVAARAETARRWVLPILMAFCYAMSVNFAVTGTQPLWSGNQEHLSPVIVILPILSLVVVGAVVCVLLVRQQRGF